MYSLIHIFFRNLSSTKHFVNVRMFRTLTNVFMEQGSSANSGLFIGPIFEG